MFDHNDRLVVALGHQPSVQHMPMKDYIAIYDSDLSLLFKQETTDLDFQLTSTDQAIAMMILP